MAAKDLLKTHEVLEATRITHQTLYRYVTLGLIEESETTAGGQRLFHPNVIELIEQIKELNQSGYSLRDIKEIFYKESRVQRLCRKDRTES
jgi:DNA-binding transcriptional MerR regulator